MKLIKACNIDMIRGTQLYDSCGNRIELITNTANVRRNNKRFKYVVEIHYSCDQVHVRSFADLASFYVEVQRKFVNVYWKDNQLSKGKSTYRSAKKAEYFGKKGKKGTHWIKAVEIT